MSATVNTYVYSEKQPLDAIIQTVRAAAAHAAGIKPLAVKLSATSIDGVYQFHFDDNGDDRILTLHTRCSCDLPTSSTLEDQVQDSRITETDNEGLVLTIGSWGRGLQISKEIATALSFLGPVVMLDEANEELGYFQAREDLMIEEVMKRYEFSAYDAAELLGALRRGGVTGPEGLEEKILSAREHMTVYEFTDEGGFSAIVAGADDLMP